MSLLNAKTLQQYLKSHLLRLTKFCRHLFAASNYLCFRGYKTGYHRHLYIVAPIRTTYLMQVWTSDSRMLGMDTDDYVILYGEDKDTGK